MKRIIILTGIIVCGIILFLIYAIVGKLEIVKENEKKESILPQICLNSINNEYFCLNDLLNKPILVIYFGTECSYCEKEAVLLLSNLDKLKDCNIVMISSDTESAVNSFAVKFEIKEVEEIRIASDTTMTFYDNFSHINIPSIFIYDKSGNLRQRFFGETSIEDILNQISIAKKDNS